MRQATILASIAALLGLLISGGQALAQEEDVFPEVVFQTSTDVDNVPGNYQLVTLVLGFEPGAWTPWHFHGGDGLVTVLEGEMTLEVLGQEPQSYAPGDQWREHVGLPHRAGNDSDEPAQLAVTFILPVDVATTVPLDIEQDPAD